MLSFHRGHSWQTLTCSTCLWAWRHKLLKRSWRGFARFRKFDWISTSTSDSASNIECRLITSCFWNSLTSALGLLDFNSVPPSFPPSDWVSESFTPSARQTLVPDWVTPSFTRKNKPTSALCTDWSPWRRGCPDAPLYKIVHQPLLKKIFSARRPKM